MKKEYNFSHADQGRFYTKPEDMEVPHYLTPDLETRIRRVALRHGKSPEDLLKGILEKELALLDQIG